MPTDNSMQVNYGKTIEETLARIELVLTNKYSVSKRAIGLLLMQNDGEIRDQVKNEEKPGTIEEIDKLIKKVQSEFTHPINYMITVKRQKEASEIFSKTVKQSPKTKDSLAEIISRLMINPITGIPILLAILYLGLYKFVGVFGAGTLVDFLESKIFGEYIIPTITPLIKYLIPYKIFQDLIIGEYGLIPLGVGYAVAIILPIVGTFSLVFAIIEDSGYLPRLALLIDRIFKRIGLSGRAVIPMVLGFGCDTMATLVTRTLETKRERLISTLLLALAIPCSAQLGVIFGILSVKPVVLYLWALSIILVLLLVGFLASKIIPGQKASFYIEIPPLRIPKVSNIMAKTYTRIKWYFFEIFPIFLIASVIIWIGQLTGLFQLLLNLMKPLVRFIGLPNDAAFAFIFGFFRRDFGAAGLYQLNEAGILNGLQLLVASVTITLFVPCIAQFLVTVKERGLKTALGIVSFILPFAFLVGYIINLIFSSIGVTL